jgi:hypothetical protein
LEGGRVSVGSESELRERLLAAACRYEPGPVRYDALLRQGRAIVVRRRVTVAVAVLLVAAVSVVTPLALRAAVGQPSPYTGSHYHVTVYPARQARSLLTDASHSAGPRLIGYGVINGQRWRLTLSVIPNSTAGGPVTISGTGGYSSDYGEQFTEPWRTTRSGPPATMDEGGGTFPTFYAGIVRSDVTRLAVRLTNGQVLSITPVAIFSARYERYFGFPVPDFSSVTEITAYAGQREVGLTYPFDRYSFMYVRWIYPGQPVPPQVHYLIGSAGGGTGRWSAWVYTGPWGACQVIFLRSTGLAECPLTPVGRGTVARILDLHISWIGRTARAIVPAIQMAQTARSVSYLVFTRADGTDFRVTTVTAGTSKYCAFLTYRSELGRHDGSTVVRWTAYNASGRELGTGPVRT